MRNKSYSELSKLRTFQERFFYLRIGGVRHMERFYEERKYNQMFYKSDKWKRVRDAIIVRDFGQDLGVSGWPVHGRLIVHHITPITPLALHEDDDILYDPENLITTSFHTHNAIHYSELYFPDAVREERRPNDTCPWKEG